MWLRLSALRTAALAAVLVSLISVSPAAAQFDLPSLGGGPLDGGAAKPKLAVEAAFTPATEQQPAMLFVTAEVPPGYHIYSLTQKKGGPVATRIKLPDSPAYQPTAPFQAATPPEIHYAEKIWPGLPLEEHVGKVTWYRPIAFAPGVEPESVTIRGEVVAQVCNPQTCIPQTQTFEARLTRQSPVEVKPTAAAEEYRPPRASVALRGHLSQKVAMPGSTVQLVLTAEPDEGWHVYAREARDPEIVGKGKPTLIVVEPGPLQATAPRTAAEVVEKESELPGVGTENYHEGPVSWTIELRIPSDAPAGSYTISGLIGYQACFDRGCKPPLGASFSAPLTIGPEPSNGRVPLAFEPVAYRQVAQAAAAQPELPEAAAPAAASAESLASQGLAKMLVLGFLGGLILNLMPCVLPVIGLKVMSFVEQAGQSRREALALNLWYSAGLVSVFLVLATLAVAAGMTWGQHFGNDAFAIVLAAIVFAMALSLVGVWEIPIPGFVGGATAHELSSQEGPLGAFLKGIITTILATPCIAPFLGTAITWAVSQPPANTYAVFGFAGLGMASPYLAIGAFPGLIRLLPKPGEWMVTFKQVMGFVLLGTVIYLLTFIDYARILPAVLLLTGIAAACWWISRTPYTAELGEKVKAWLVAGTITAVVAYVSFAETVGTFPVVRTVPGLYGVMQYRLDKYVARHSGQQIEHQEGELPWQYFSPQKLAQLKQQGKTVLVDITADWCLTCKTLEQTVLNTDEVIELVDQNDVATLLADYTDYPPDIQQMLDKLQSNGIPVVAIFPAGQPDNPIVFRGGYTKSALLEALRQAGPSQPGPIETAMRR